MYLSRYFAVDTIKFSRAPVPGEMHVAGKREPEN